MYPRQSRKAGFTLIELVVVVAIIGILAAIAVPAYKSYIVRGNRAAARACVAEITQYMERYYTNGLTYVGATLTPPQACQTAGSLNTRYTITIGTLAQGTYVVTATPIGAQLTGDTACGTMTVNQAGTQTATGTSGVATCWSR